MGRTTDETDVVISEEHEETVGNLRESSYRVEMEDAQEWS